MFRKTLGPAERSLVNELRNHRNSKKRATEALAYNGLVQSWPEIVRLAREGGKSRTEQGALFEKEEN